MDETLFGRYRLMELLDRGRMAEVWRARDTAIDRVVALKVLPANFTDDGVFQQRFRSEVGAAAGLDEPHVVPIHDFGEIEGRLFVAMRLIKGRNLQDLLSEGPLAPARAVGIIEQIASALHAAHAVGLVHGDVKPSKILVAANDFSYLIDFGPTHADGETGLSNTGATIETWAYMAPERFEQGTFDEAADIYALTCVLYQSLTGQVPFAGDSVEQIADAHKNQPPPHPSAVGHGIPAQLDNVVAIGMAKDPDNRYATTEELANAAREAISTPVTAARHDFTSAPAKRRTPRRQTSPKRRPATTLRWRLRVAAIAAGVLLSVIVAVAAATILRPANQKSPATRQQSTLPFVGIKPHGLAVGYNGTVYVTDDRSQKVLSLAAGSTRPTVLPFDGLDNPDGVAVGHDGTVYVADNGNNRVLSLAEGATSQTILPFTGLSYPSGVEVDDHNDVYVSDDGNNRVLSLAPGSTNQVVLPFTELRNQFGLAVASNGTVYVADYGNNRVVSLAAHSTDQTVLPFTGLRHPFGMTVDSNGTVYVADDGNNRVVSLAAGSATQTVLPFTGLREPDDVDVDSNGTVYVADYGNNRVVSLPTG